jgi:drug/metabolite transporter (DMT)-like permease
MFWRLIAAFVAVYVIWGSTYLGIRVAVETVPPLLMAGMRQATAGLLLYAWLRWRGTPRPERIHWRSAAIVGALMLLIGNGGVAWAERVVPSGLTALLVATSPLWMALIEWLWHGAARPGGQMVAGLILGFVGAGLLVAPASLGGGSHVDSLGALALLVATLGWAAGALYSRRAKLPASAFLGAAMEMTAGGAMLLVASALIGECRGFAWSHISPRSWVALLYLTTFGSMIAYTAYMWLLQVSTAARVSTTAYVNPIIAVLLGWWLGGEAIGARILIAAGIIVVAVALIISHRPALPSETA